MTGGTLEIMNNTPYWETTAPIQRYPRQAGDVRVDVVVIGGGITGISCAYQLKQKGLKVALVERERCASRDTGHTTAHLTFVTDTRLTELASAFGEPGAQAIWDAGQAGLMAIYDTVRHHEIDCEFAWTPGYLHSPIGNESPLERTKLDKEAALARRLGFQAEFVTVVPLMRRSGIRFPNQGKFHPRKYAAALLEWIDGNGSYVFEETSVEAMSDHGREVTTSGGKILCERVVVATHVPLQVRQGLLGDLAWQTKMTPYSTYVIGAQAAPGSLPEACFWDTANPYNYLRVERQASCDFLIFGGEDHKTGQQADTLAPYVALESRLRRILADVEVTHRWSGQVIETGDGLPFIGESAPNIFIASGFAGNGMTFGTVSALMACDWIMRRANPWRELFSPSRKLAGRSTLDFIKENSDYPYYLVKERLRKAETALPESLAPGEGKVLQLDGQKMAVFRDDQGRLRLHSAVCPHLGCVVHWNPGERTWDCPCHGSRFKVTGEVIAGPAQSGLEAVGS